MGAQPPPLLLINIQFLQESDKIATEVGVYGGGDFMSWFSNRKSIDNSQRIHRLKLRDEEIITKVEALESSIRLIQLEVADYHEKTRRLYLRMAKRERDESPEVSEPTEQPFEESGTAKREKILRNFKRGK